ncbi:hypothetical protein HS7_09790 [Sulfolobales archaeon HS-7]|nr:hypothetical protein HS7_09790 [Sulfolobales archaeon HS-7]
MHPSFFLHIFPPQFIIAYVVSIFLGFYFIKRHIFTIFSFIVSSLPLLTEEFKPIFLILNIIGRKINEYLWAQIFIRRVYLHDPAFILAVVVGISLITRLIIFRVTLLNVMIRDPSTSAYVKDVINQDLDKVSIRVINSGKPLAYSFSLLGRAIIILSVGLLESMEKEEVRAVILHEYAHIRLHHTRKKMMLYIFLPLYSVNPFSYAIFKEVNLTMESEADEFATKLSGIENMRNALNKIVSMFGSENRGHK